MDSCLGRKDSSSLTCSGQPQAPGPWKQVYLLRHPAWAAEEAEHCLGSCDRAMRCTSNVSHAGCGFLAENSNSHQMPHLLVELKSSKPQYWMPSITPILLATYFWMKKKNLGDCWSVLFYLEKTWLYVCWCPSSTLSPLGNVNYIFKIENAYET